MSVHYDVLIVSAFARKGGGIEAVVEKLSQQLVLNKFKVALIAGNDKTARFLYKRQSGVNIFLCRHVDFIEPRFGLPLPIWLPRSLIVLWKIIARARVIHLHDYLYIPCIAAMLFARLQRKPVILTQHIGELPLKSSLVRNMVTLFNHTLGRCMLGSAKQVVFIAQPVMDFFSGFVSFSNPPKLIPNGVDHSLYKPNPNYQLQKVWKLLFVGRFVEKKGIHLLKQCLDIDNVHWTFVGWGPLSPLNWPDLPATVTVIENAPPEEIVPLYQQADLLLLPSIGEGFPLVIQEALACGTPVLTSTVVANTCPQRDPNCVFDVDVSGPGAATRVRTAINALIAEPDTLRLGRKHAIELSKQWSWESCAASYGHIYHAIVEKLSKSN